MKILDGEGMRFEDLKKGDILVEPEQRARVERGEPYSGYRVLIPCGDTDYPNGRCVRIH